MSEGCTDCGRKGGCDHRKAGMFEAIEEALARLYPTRRWAERDETSAFRAGVAAPVAERLADRLAASLETLALLRRGGPEETCDFVYALCFGRQPTILEVREGAAPASSAWAESAHQAGRIDELYLRVALSTVAPFAAVQQVTLSMTRAEDDLVIVEAPRTGVFDPVLLPRFRKVVAALAELEVRHLDFGDLTAAPEAFDAGDYGGRYGGLPTLANYLFFPQPAAAVSTTVIPVDGPFGAS